MTPESPEEPRSTTRSDAETAGHPIVQASGVEHAFDSVAVLQDIDVELEASAVTALVGPNGSGKTTLLRILAGVVDPDTGEVEVRAGGERPIGYLPQEPSFRGVFTVEETIDFYAALLSSTVDPDAVLKRVGLDVVAQRRVDALSGGMRHLLGLAIAILGDPPLVVLDEPASGLDPKIRAHVFDAIRDLADQNTAVLLATHHLQGAELADRLAVIDRGVLVADGTPEEILSTAEADSLEDAFLALVSDGLAVQAGTEGSV